jgi:hypothetical protein
VTVFEALHDMSDPVDVLRPATVRKYAEEAGFTTTAILPIDTPYWRFYRLR